MRGEAAGEIEKRRTIRRNDLERQLNCVRSLIQV